MTTNEETGLARRRGRRITYLERNPALVAPGSVPASSVRGAAAGLPEYPVVETVAGLRTCVLAIRSLPELSADVAAGNSSLGTVVQAYTQLLANLQYDFPALQCVEHSLHIPRARGAFIRRWFGDVKGFPHTDTLATMVEQGVPIAVKPGSDVTVAVEYGNHKSVAPFADKVRSKSTMMSGWGGRWCSRGRPLSVFLVCVCPRLRRWCLLPK